MTHGASGPYRNRTASKRIDSLNASRGGGGFSRSGGTG